jgi:RHS repeat-associated protein
MVLTDQKDTTAYTMLTFEGASGSAEATIQNNVWESATGQPINVTAVRTTAPGVLQNSGLQPPPLSNALLVRSSTGKIGAGKLIKVMAGDRIHTSVQYYYPSTGTQPVATGLNTLLGGLGSVISNSVGAGGLLKTASSTLAQGVGLDPMAISFFSNQNSSSLPTKPKAYLNVLFFDEQFNIVASASKYQQVGTGFMNPNSPGQIGFMAGSAALAQKSGYCYIYISNESDDLVYFDNFTLSHERSSLIEETHYYPFGLAMKGISSKAAGSLANKKLFNSGSELQSEEFYDGSGLEWYDVDARFYDPQLGRFMQVDPQPAEGEQESYQPYQYALDNPISYNDPDGEVWNLVVGAVVGATVDYGMQVVSNLASGKTLSQSLTQVDGKSILKSAVIGAVTSGASAFVAKAGAKVAANVGAKVAARAEKVVQTEKKIAEGAKTIQKLEQRAEKLSTTPRPGQNVTRAGQKVTKDLNKARNGGQTRCESCGNVTEEVGNIGAGGKVPKFRTEVDHYNPASNGGSGTPVSNGIEQTRVLCNGCNGAGGKGTTVPTIFPRQ